MDMKSSQKPAMDAQGLRINMAHNLTINTKTAAGTVTTGSINKTNNDSPAISMTFTGQSTPTVVTKPPIVISTPQVTSVTRSGPESVPSPNSASINQSKSIDSYGKSVPEVTPSSCFATCPAQKNSQATASLTSPLSGGVRPTLSSTQPISGQGFGINPIVKPARAFGATGSPTGSAEPVLSNKTTTSAYGVRVDQAVPLSTLTSPVGKQKSTESGQKSASASAKPLDSSSSDFKPSKNQSLTSGSSVNPSTELQSGTAEKKPGNPCETETISKKSISGGQPASGSTKSGLKILDHHSEETGTVVVGKSSAFTASATLSTGRKEPGQPQPPHNNQLINPSQTGNKTTNINQQKVTPTTSTVTDSSTSISSVNSPSTGTNPVFSTVASDRKTTFVTKTTSASSQKAENIMDSQPLIHPLTEASVKSQATEAKDGNINVMMNGNNKGAALMDLNKNINSTNTDAKTVVNGNSGVREVPKSVQASTMNQLSSAFSSRNTIPSRARTAPAQIETRESESDSDDDQIGDDVKMFMRLIEMAGLCAPERSDESQSAPASRPGTANNPTSGQYTSRPGTVEKPIGDAVADINDGSYPIVTVNKPNIVSAEVVDGIGDGQPTATLPVSTGKDKSGANMKNGTPNRSNSASRTKKDASPSPGFRKELSKPKTVVPSDNNSPSGRPPTGAKARPSTGVSKSSGDKLAAGNAAFDTVHSQSTLFRNSSRGKSFPNSTTISTFEPRSTKSSRMRNSLPRAASASMSTAQKTPDTSRSGIHYLDESRPRSAISISSSEHNNKAGARSSRPSSTLYQHTASSAQKGIRVTTPSPLTQNNLSTSSRASPSPSTPRTSRSTLPRTARSKMGDSGAGDTKPVPATVKDQFAAFSRFGDTSSDGKQITLSNCDKWMKQAHVIDGKKITTTDTSICFKKLFKTAKKVSFEDFNKYIEDLAKNKKIEPQELLDKLQNSGPPSLSTATKAAHAGVVERLTDTSKYTGSHKERFDSTGKGKGIEGRRDVADSSGYVNSFKNKLDLNKPDSKEASPAK